MDSLEHLVTKCIFRTVCARRVLATGLWQLKKKSAEKSAIFNENWVANGKFYLFSTVDATKFT